MTKILRGLRGATTARANTSEAILQATAELLRALLEANGFQPEDVESAIFTSSPDLTAEYPARAARLLGWRDVPLLGASVGSPAEADRVRPWPADYWSVGPCYATDNKPDAGSPLGPDGFARLARLAPAGVPVIGIGGITAANAAAIRRGGAVGVAVIGAIWGASDPERAARALRSAAA